MPRNDLVSDLLSTTPAASLRYANPCCSAKAAHTSLSELAGGVDEGGANSQKHSHEAGPADRGILVKLCLLPYIASFPNQTGTVRMEGSLLDTQMARILCSQNNTRQAME